MVSSSLTRDGQTVGRSSKTYAPASAVTDSDAIHDNAASEISAITEKNPPLAADLHIIEDTADSNNKKRVQAGNLPGGVKIDDSGNLFTPDDSGVVVGHSSQVDFGATPKFQVLGTGTPDASMAFARFQNTDSGPDVRFLKSRGAAIGDNVIVQDGDTLGRFRFQGADGGDFNTTAAEIIGQVDGATSLNDIPGRLVFRTRIDNGALTDKMILDNQGRLGIDTTSLTAKLYVDQKSTTAAIPVLTLDQADVSEEMIDFVTTIGTGNAIEAVGAKALTTTHFIKVTLPGGLTRYISCGTIA